MNNKNYNYIIKHIRPVNEINTPPIRKRKITVDRYYKKSFQDAINYLGIQNDINSVLKNKIGREKMRTRQRFILDKLLERAKKGNFNNKNKFINISKKVIQDYEKKNKTIPRNTRQIKELLSFFKN